MWIWQLLAMYSSSTAPAPTVAVEILEVIFLHNHCSIPLCTSYPWSCLIPFWAFWYYENLANPSHQWFCKPLSNLLSLSSPKWRISAFFFPHKAVATASQAFWPAFSVSSLLLLPPSWEVENRTGSTEYRVHHSFVWWQNVTSHLYSVLSLHLFFVWLGFLKVFLLP